MFRHKKFPNRQFYKKFISADDVEKGLFYLSYQTLF